MTTVVLDHEQGSDRATMAWEVELMSRPARPLVGGRGGRRRARTAVGQRVS